MTAAQRRTLRTVVFQREDAVRRGDYAAYERLDQRLADLMAAHAAAGRGVAAGAVYAEAIASAGGEL